MKTKPHYSEADLLETYYTQPGESMPVMLHLADCAECAVRYERIERKVRGLAACDHDEKPESFWARQRISVMRRVAQQPRTSSVARVTRVAAAAVLALALGGVVTWNQRTNVAPPVQSTTAALVKTGTTAPSTESVLTKQSEDSTDPWQSDELKEFGSMVEWESWVDNGDQSL
ncbi:MAG TPA: hypothetical protein VHW00_01915 [Thermoanaerobaculia bacterium]|nr:hypothetical protein [Thermoanaerobaculia bacterium]